MECEIKLAIDAAGAIRLKKSPVLRAHAVSKPEEREHVDRYFDMPGLTLWKHGFALRVKLPPEPPLRGIFEQREFLLPQAARPIAPGEDGRRDVEFAFAVPDASVARSSARNTMQYRATEGWPPTATPL